MKEKLKQGLIELLRQFIEENEIEFPSELIIDERTRLIGTSSIFDSMELVQFIVEVESFLEDNFEIEVDLTSEKAMSRRNSPFISISTLIDFVIDA